MFLNDDLPNTSSRDGSLLAGQRKWAVGVVVVAVALVGLWLSSVLDGTGFLPVFAVAIAVIGGAGMALWLVKE